MATAIELYRKAYDLDYRKGDWESAEQLYKQIIEQHPYADEKEYALVHLERLQQLKSDPMNQELQPIRASGKAINGFNVFNFIVVLLLLVAVGMLGYLVWQQRAQVEYQGLLLEAMFDERVGRVDEAVALYKVAQEMLPGETMAYRLLAERYLGQSQFELAEIEARKWKLARPADPALGDFSLRLRAKETTFQKGQQ